MSAHHDKVTEDSVAMIERLREARAEMEALWAPIDKELKLRSRQGKSCFAHQCAAWPRYQAARSALASLRDLYEV